MRNRFLCLALLLTASFVPLFAHAQTSDKPKEPAQEDRRFLKLDFLVREVDENGKVLNSRSYSSSAVTGDGSAHSIRTGSRVPVATSMPGTQPTQFTYIDAGVNIDFRRPELFQGQLSMIVTGDISSFVKPSEDEVQTAPNQPVIRQNRWDAAVLIPLGKPTIIFSSDDVTTKHKLQLELTASLIK